MSELQEIPFVRVKVGLKLIIAAYNPNHHIPAALHERANGSGERYCLET